MKITVGKNAHLIKEVVRYVEGKAELVVRMDCPFCGTGYGMLLVGRTGRYECQICSENGKLQDLVVYVEDKFQHRHRGTIRTMGERAAVEKIEGER